MININLLPWREEERKLQKLRFALVVMGTICLALFFVVLLHLYYNRVIATQQDRNDFLQSQISQQQAILATLIKQKKVQTAVDDELRFVISLRETSYRAIRLLDELARVIPEGVLVSKLVRGNNKLTIIGRAKSNLEVTELMKNISKSTIFKQPELTILSSKETSSGEERTFQLKVEQQG